MTASRKRLRLGMVGGGKGSFIGGVHRIASRIDDRFELVAGVLSSDPMRAAESAADLGIVPARAYADFKVMAKAEAKRADGIEVVAIVTPNHMHAAPIIAFLQAGIHVICDKPLCATMAEAQMISEAVKASDAHFVLTHTYTGYPLIRQARKMIADGELGQMRVIQVEYAQDWLTQTIEQDGQKQADWRTDPAKSGGGGAIGDIGTHAVDLLCFVTGLKPEALLADLHRFGDGRRLDDNAHILLHMQGGAKAMLWASQIAVGNENGLRLRVYGDRGGLEWSQENPNKMCLTIDSEAKRILTRGGVGSGGAMTDWTRIPAGHPEGYLESFANIYTDTADLIERKGGGALLAGIRSGLEGMQFIEACVNSAGSGGTWVPFQQLEG
ncbi:Gfo/Idh/MocA family oxidoreductase [uncultured Boseongicola sp.]|jgi:predicted dehydrogenase|uniref:Gfo/Idh/MocA family protein n=1 Tax=uncultured Boseongicola sp. TaxID=1648499 RepID=UPI002636423E|nr:Gfo/Idh/MocA family oxidoreductase [uncultured Boseongicola sp.]